MSKKFGKFLLFSAIAGAAAYGAYQYLQNKEQTASPAAADDDLDDFNEDLDEEPTADKERSYVSLNLDKAAAIASESFHKAKEVIADSVQQVRDTVKSVAENQSSFETNFTDLTALKRESGESKDDAAKTTDDTVEAVTEDFFTSEAPDTPPTETFFEDTKSSTVEPESSASSERVEEFFDDDDDTP